MPTETPSRLGVEIPLPEVLRIGPTPIPWAVQGLIAEGDIMHISGPGGIGKSYVLTQLAIDMAIGQPLFGQFAASRDYRILYLDLEMAQYETARRMQRMLVGAGLTAETVPDGLHVFSRGSILLDRPDSVAELGRYLEANRIDFVLVDSIRRVIMGDENDSGVANRLLRTTKLFRDQFNCGFVFLAHHRKPKEDPMMNDPGNMLRGSSDWRNIADCHIAIAKNPSADHLTIIPDKSRHEEVLEPFTVRFNHQDRTDDNGPFVISYVESAAETTVNAKVLAFVGANPEATRKQMVEGLNLTPKLVRKATEALAAGGFLQTAEGGGRGQILKYRRAGHEE